MPVVVGCVRFPPLATSVVYRRKFCAKRHARLISYQPGMMCAIWDSSSVGRAPDPTGEVPGCEWWPPVQSRSVP